MLSNLYNINSTENVMYLHSNSLLAVFLLFLVCTLANNTCKDDESCSTDGTTCQSSNVNSYYNPHSILKQLRSIASISSCKNEIVRGKYPGSVIVNPQATDYSLIWMHGLGDTPAGFAQIFSILARKTKNEKIKNKTSFENSNKFTEKKNVFLNSF